MVASPHRKKVSKALGLFLLMQLRHSLPLFRATDVTDLRQLSEIQTFAKFSAFSDIFTKSKSQTFSQTFKNF